MRVYKYVVEEDSILKDCRLASISRAGHKPIAIDKVRKERAFREDTDCYILFLLTNATPDLKHHYKRHKVRSIFAGVSDDEKITIESNLKDLILK